MRQSYLVMNYFCDSWFKFNSRAKLSLSSNLRRLMFHSSNKTIITQVWWNNANRFCVSPLQNCFDFSTLQFKMRSLKVRFFSIKRWAIDQTLVEGGFEESFYERLFLKNKITYFALREKKTGIGRENPACYSMFQLKTREKRWADNSAKRKFEKKGKKRKQ